MYLCLVVFSQSEDDIVSLLQNLADMDITYKALQVKLVFFAWLFVGNVEGKIGFDSFFRQHSSRG
jgi:hypothetical protein